MTLSVSIVNFNTQEHLRRCLESIPRNVGCADYEVIVADNASADSSIRLIKDQYPKVKLIENKDNLGATIAKNQTFKIAQGKYILILDSDIEILPGAVSQMVKFLEQNPTVGIVGPSVSFGDNRPQHSCNKTAPTLWASFLNKFFLFARLRYGFYRSRLGGEYIKKRYAKPERFAWLGGMCLLARRDVIQATNGMDENYFIYYDDADFCLMAGKLGWQVWYLPGACVIHHMGKGVGQFKEFLFPKIFASELYFFKKHQGKQAARACAVFVCANMLARIAANLPVFCFNAKAARVKYQAYTAVLNTAKAYIK